MQDESSREPRDIYTIVIPTCNRPHQLANCLERIAANLREYREEQFEVIVSDDGSDESSRTETAAKFPWLTIVRGPRRGPAANRNFGANHAIGDWLLFVDDDCLPETGWLSAFLKEHDAGVDVMEGKTTSSDFDNPSKQEAPLNMTGGNFWSCNLMVRKSVFDALGGFDERFAYAAYEDIDFAKRLRSFGYRTKFVPDAVVEHPARPRKFGFRTLKSWESRALFDNIHRGGFRGLYFHALKVRLMEIVRCRKIPGWLRLSFSHFIELICMPFLIPVWHYRYRDSRGKPWPTSNLIAEDLKQF